MKPSLTVLRNQLEVANTKKIMLKEEPALNTGFNVTLGMGGIGSLLLIAHGLFPKIFTQDVIGTISFFTALIVPLVTAYFARKKVWSPATVLRLLNAAATEADNLRRDLKASETARGLEEEPPMPQNFRA